MPVFIDVIPNRTSGAIEWELCSKQDGQPRQCSKTKANYPIVSLGKGSGSDTFTVTIQDPQKQVKFAADPLWVQQGANNPPKAPVFDAAGQIPKVTRVSDTQIKFVNLNNNKGELTLSYSLSFTGAPLLDPEIKNGGTTRSGLSATTELLIGAALAIALILLVLVPWLARASNRQRHV